MKVEVLLLNEGGVTSFAVVVHPSDAPGAATRIAGRAPADPTSHKPVWSRFQPDEKLDRALTAYLRGEGGSAIAELEGAQVNPGEYVHLIDERTADVDGEVPFHDIVGAYRSDPRGLPVVGSFERNGKHAIVDASGRLSSWLSNDGFAAYLRATR